MIDSCSHLLFTKIMWRILEELLWHEKNSNCIRWNGEIEGTDFILFLLNPNFAIDCGILQITSWKSKRFQVMAKICTKYRKHWKSYASPQMSVQTRSFLAVLKISVILLMYATLKVVFSCFRFHVQKSTKLRFSA